MVPEDSVVGDKVVAAGEYELFVSDGTTTEALNKVLTVVA
jgi:hypothetical protein